MISDDSKTFKGEKFEMSACPCCGAVVAEGAVYCGNCGTVKNSTDQLSISQSRVTAQESTPSINQPSGDLQSRLEKAMRRAEMLTYAAVGLGIALLVVIIVISQL